MAQTLIWLPEVLLAAGLKVAETPGWADRGRGPMGTLRGVMCHHTGSPGPRNMPTLNLLINGRTDLPGPLAQLGLGRDGTYYVVAAGRANHAGGGVWQGVTTGNSSFIGIEAENAGTDADVWPDVQMDAYMRGAAALLRKIGAGAEWCCAHREYARPVGRKPDPHGIDMVEFRAEVHRIIYGAGIVRPQIPAVAPSGHPTLRRGMKGDAVLDLQQKLALAPADGIFGALTEVATREFQRAHDLVPDGIVGPKTWELLAPPPPPPSGPAVAPGAASAPAP